MPEIITTVEDATPAWFTATLRRAGVLPQGTVVAVEQAANAAFNSTVRHCTLSYSADAPVGAPRHLLVKLNHEEGGVWEVGFYRLVAELDAPLPMLVPSYAAEYDPQTGDSVCLLVDLSATHGDPVPRAQVLALQGVPTEAQLGGIVDALARFHAYWWEHPRLAEGASAVEVTHWYSDRAAFARHIERRTNEWTAFIAAEGATFPAELRRLYEHALPRLPGLWDRYFAPRIPTRTHLTLVNGDCYFCQFLCPLDPARSDTYLVDFQEAHTDFAANDLAYLFPTFWTAAQRHENGREERLLRHYHAGLLAHGVRGYGWDDLWRDYRLMIVLMIFEPLWHQTYGAGRAYWWPKLQCLTAAYQDLHCADLLAD